MICERVVSIDFPEVCDQEIDLSWFINSGNGIVRSFLTFDMQLNVLTDHQSKAFVFIRKG